MTHSITSTGQGCSRLSARSVLQKAVPFEVATGDPHPLTRAKICDLCTLAPNNLTDKTLRSPLCQLARFFFGVGLPASGSCPISSGVWLLLGALISWRHFSEKA